jgi:hypothetical protein
LHNFNVLGLGVKFLTEFCNGTLDLSNMSAGQQRIISDIAETQAQLADLPSINMCTWYCPCPPSNANTNFWL